MRPSGGITPGADCRLRHIRDCWNVWQALPDEDRDIDALATFTGITHQKLRTDYMPMIRKMESMAAKGLKVETLLDRSKKVVVLPAEDTKLIEKFKTSKKKATTSKQEASARADEPPEEPYEPKKEPYESRKGASKAKSKGKE